LLRQSSALQEQRFRYYRPFVKWAGGKTQLLARLDSHHLPADFGRYFEPFLGGGAVFFHLLSKKKRFDAFLSDVNSDLMTAYSAVKNDVSRLIDILRMHEEKFRKERGSYYYALREAPAPSDGVERAARLIMFNKTCFNGLYRVNKSGRFNVPLGSYANPKICDEEALRQASAALRISDARLSTGHYSEVLKKAGRNDLVYLDPPYSPTNNTSRFTEYTNEGFGDDDQRELAETFARLTDRGCKAILSNSDTPFVRRLYSGYAQDRVSALRAINCKGARRRGHTELFIRNFV
jgi:DNA adenine methylase